MKTRSSSKRSSLLKDSETDEVTPEKVIKLSEGDADFSRKKSKKGKRNPNKNYSTSPSDKGYGDSSCDDAVGEKKIIIKSEKFDNHSSKKRKNVAVIAESTDSSSDDYLVPCQSLDLNSDFFKIEKKEPVADFSSIENTIFAGINKLSDSEASDASEEMKPTAVEITGNRSVPQHDGPAVKVEQSGMNLVSIKHETANGVNTQLTGKTKKSSHMKQKMPAASNNNSKDEANRSVKVSVKKPSHDTSRKQQNLPRKHTQDGYSRKGHNKMKEEASAPDVNSLDVLQLLALGESQSSKLSSSSDTVTKSRVCKAEIDSEEEQLSDWEEVNGLEAQHTKYAFPKEGIAVTVQVPNIHQKKKKQGFDMAAFVKRRMNKVRRDIQVLMHKAHLLCWIAHGNYVNKTLNSEILMGLSLSLIPSKHCYPDKHTDLKYLQQIVQWFSNTIQVEKNGDGNKQLLESLEDQFQKKVARSRRDLVFMFVCVLRSLGINARLVLSLQPVPLKPPMSEISNVTSKKAPSGSGLAEKKGKGNVKKKAHSTVKKVVPDSSTKGAVRKRRDVMTKEEAVRRIKEAAATKLKQGGKTDHKQRGGNMKGKEVNINPVSLDDSSRSLRIRKSVKKYIDEPDITESDEGIDHNCKSSRSVDENLSKKSPVIRKNDGGKTGSQNMKANKASIKQQTLAGSSENESDYSPELKIKTRKSDSIDRRVLSSGSVSDENLDTKKKKDRCDVWSEVFVESEEKWICVDVYHKQIHCVRELYTRATQPVQYVLAWQEDSSIRDVTRRYCTQWHTVTQKHRVDDSWWNDSLKPFEGHKTTHDKEEEDDLQRQLQDRPLPTSMAEYKNHPLYILKKDLLKFQAIYPPDAPTLGFVKGHPVYARECVHTLHSRELWLKEAKVVKLGETPYKIVKARPKWDRMSGQLVKDRPLEVFGFWQVEDYVPPAAVDGKVPRNAYGNVELFKPSMLPAGTVHMQIPGLNRVARKLQIDCAPAVIGFDYHCGACHAVTDGFVVCEEFKDVLAEAWQAEEEEADRRYEEKMLKRIYGNWRRLIKGVLIRERLKARYAFGTVAETTKHKEKKMKKSKGSKKMKVVDSDESD